MTTEKHVLEVVLQNATVRVAVVGVILSCTVAQPGPRRSDPGVYLDGKPWLVGTTPKEGA